MERIQSEKNLQENQNKIKLAPSKARILSMPLNMLIEHYNLIQLKKSSLPSAQRAMVNNRIKFSLDKGRINEMDISISMDNLKNIYK